MNKAKKANELLKKSTADQLERLQRTAKEQIVQTKVEMKIEFDQFMSQNTIEITEDNVELLLSQAPGTP